MAWLMLIWEEQPMFEWQDKSGAYADRETPMPFSMLTPSPKVFDTSNILTAAIQTGGGKPADVMRIHHCAVVSERFKRIVEEFEPGVHQFFPVTLNRKNGAPYDEAYFIFHPTQNAPCVLLSKCDLGETIIVKYGARKGMPIPHVHYDGYVISRPAYGDRKIFGSIFVKGDCLLVTDDVMARIKEENISNLYTRPAKEIDESFIFEKEDPSGAEYLRKHPEFQDEFRLEVL